MPGVLTTSTQNTTSGTSSTISHTTDTGTDVLVVTVGSYRSGGSTVSSVTFNGTNLTQAVTAANGADERSDIWYLANPTIGTQDVVINMSASSEIQATIFNLDDTDTTTPTTATNTATGSSATPSVVITSATGELCVCAISWYNQTFTVGTGSTIIELIENGAGNDSHVSQHEAGAASVTMDGTLSATANWVIVGASFQPGVGGGSTNPKGPLGHPLHGPFGGPVL